MSFLEDYKASIGLTPDFSVTSIRDITFLARKHFQKYPFTTLGIHLGHNITLDPEFLLRELVDKGYGLCYHHNAVFYILLNSLQIPTAFIATSVRKPGDHENSFELESHVGLILEVHGQRYLFDPGFDGTAHSPILIENKEDASQWYSIRSSTKHSYAYTFLERRDDCLVPIYDFNTTATKLAAWGDAYKFVASTDYPFWTVMLYSQTGEDGKIYRLVSILNFKSTLLLFSSEGEVLEKIEGDLSKPLLNIFENRINIPEKVMRSIHEGQFRNPDMDVAIKGITLSMK
jgi:arylamine N-acetyltransferase